MEIPTSHLRHMFVKCSEVNGRGLCSGFVDLLIKFMELQVFFGATFLCRSSRAGIKSSWNGSKGKSLQEQR